MLAGAVASLKRLRQDDSRVVDGTPPAPNFREAGSPRNAGASTSRSDTSPKETPPPRKKRRGARSHLASKGRLCASSPSRSTSSSGYTSADDSPSVTREIYGDSARATEVIECAPISGTTLVPTGRDWTRNRRKPLKGRVPATPVLRPIAARQVLMPNRLAHTALLVAASRLPKPSAAGGVGSKLGTDTPPYHAEPRPPRPPVEFASCYV